MNWARFAQILELIGSTTLTALNPAYGLIASGLIGVINTAEASGLPGAQKLANVLAQVPTIITGVNGAAGSQVVDPAIVTDLPVAISKVISVVNDIGKPIVVAAAPIPQAA